MNKFAIRLLTFAMALIAVPLTTAYAAGSDNPAPPASDTKKEKKKHDKSSSIDDPKFLEGYHKAYADLRPQRLWLGHRAVEGARPGRPRRRRQSDRLLLSQARRLQGVADLV